MGFHDKMIISKVQKILIFVILISMFSFLDSCSHSSFKKDALNAGDILQNAFRLEQFGAPKSIDGDGSSVVRIYSNKAKSKEYLNENKEKLRLLYKKIRAVADQPDSENYYNALFVCATINQSLFLLSDSTFEDEPDMVNKILEPNAIQQIDDWVVNEFYGKIEVPKDLLKDWILMERSKKLEAIFDGIVFKNRAMRATGTPVNN